MRASSRNSCRSPFSLFFGREVTHASLPCSKQVPAFIWSNEFTKCAQTFAGRFLSALVEYNNRKKIATNNVNFWAIIQTGLRTQTCKYAQIATYQLHNYPETLKSVRFWSHHFIFQTCVRNQISIFQFSFLLFLCHFSALFS